MSDRDIMGEVRYDVVEEVDEHTGVDGITEQVLRRPDVLAALQGRLHEEMLEVIVLLLSVNNWFVAWSHVRICLETTTHLALCPSMKLAALLTLLDSQTGDGPESCLKTELSQRTFFL